MSDEETGVTDGLLKIPAAANAIGVSVGYLRKRIKEGAVPALKIGNRTLVNAEAAKRALMRESAGVFADQLYGSLDPQGGE